MDRTVPLITEASRAGQPVIIVVPDQEAKVWVQHLDSLENLPSGASIRLLIYPVNLRGWTWGVRAAFVAAQRSLEERLEGGGRDVLVVVRLPDVLLLVGESRGVAEVEQILANLTLLGTVVCAYHESLVVPRDVAERHVAA